MSDETKYIVIPASFAGTDIDLNTGKTSSSLDNKMTLKEAGRVAQARANGFDDKYVIVEVIKIVLPE